MTIGARIDADDAWHTGEDKVLVFTVRDVDGAIVTPNGWTARWQLFARRAKRGATALVTRDVVGAGGVITVTVPAASTSALAAGTYEHVLRRTDVGSVAVLAYDSVELGAAP